MPESFEEQIPRFCPNLVHLNKYLTRTITKKGLTNKSMCNGLRVNELKIKKIIRWFLNGYYSMIFIQCYYKISWKLM